MEHLQLFLALKAINLKTNDVVVLPSINFIRRKHIKNYGAKIVFQMWIKLWSNDTTEIRQCIKKNKLKKIKVFYNAQ